MTASSYDSFSVKYLTALYFFIKTNIEKGLLSYAMCQELALIKEAAKKQGVIIIGGNSNWTSPTNHFRGEI
ncbi:hypothetical protein [Sporolactobacillus putidus]|uniref:Uncharacterized protein n=1 Tax=Sporolactobacillus putidus TaxID=492735 RepID=A0A917S6F0_9BACL|nr:hypothetical protein [Sporolactobacillus putidus]GGL61213.1 hypothetical protein GCM10007968_26510 [Sporolactobacillus putidus]